MGVGVEELWRVQEGRRVEEVRWVKYGLGEALCVDEEVCNYTPVSTVYESCGMMDVGTFPAALHVLVLPQSQSAPCARLQHAWEVPWWMFEVLCRNCLQQVSSDVKHGVTSASHHRPGSLHRQG